MASKNNKTVDPEVVQENNVALIGFIISIFSIATFGLLSVLGLILSLIGLVNSKKIKNGKRGLAVSGIIISSITLIVGIILFVCILPSNNGSGYNDDSNSNYSNTEKTEPKEEKKIEVTIPDFSTMQKSEVENWCNTNNITCNFKTSYSDTVPKDGFVSQEHASGTKLEENSNTSITYSLGKQATISQQNALKSAQSYLKYSAFSYTGLIEQLEYEKYSHEDAVYAVDNCGADWFEQAKKSAESYLKYSAFSRDGLIDQLEYEGFTYEQAVYGVEQNGL